MGKKVPYEELAAKAEKYDVLTEFRRKEKKAYDIINKRGLIAELCGHMKRERTAFGVLTKEHCRSVAQGYKARTDFSKGSPKEYSAAQRNGWLEDICSHMAPKCNWRQRKIYAYTFSDGYAYVGLTQDPDKRHRDHLGQDENSPVLRHIRATGIRPDYKLLTDWLDYKVAGKVEEDCCREYEAEGWKMLNKRHCGSLGSPKQTFYTHERLVAEISKYEYHEDFKLGSPGFYEYLVSHRLLKKYCSQLKRRKTPHHFWSVEQSVQAAGTCKSRMELNKRYPGAYEVLRRAWMLEELLPINKGLPKMVHMARIAECSSRSDLYHKYQSTYNWALRNRMMDDLFETKVHERTYEENLRIVKGCKSRKELRAKYGRVYKWGLKNGILDQYLPNPR